MKRRLFFLLLIGMLAFKFPASDIVKIRELYYKASVNKNDAELFYKVMYNEISLGKSLVEGYRGISNMIKANFALNPYNKLSYFLRGKNLLEAAINSDPANTELRFLRFSVQTNAPAFLGYSSKIHEDKAIIFAAFPVITDKDLKSRIRNFMLASASVTENEKKLFKPD